MITEITLLKLFLDSRDTLAAYGSYVKYDALHHETKTILQDIDLYYQTFKTETKVSMEKFITFFQQVRHPEITKTQRKIYLAIFKRLEEAESSDESENFAKIVLNHFKKENAKEKISALLEQTELPVDDLKATIQSYIDDADLLEEEDFVANEFNDIFVTTQRTDGFTWRLDCLNRSIGPLIRGDFGFVAAYVDTGKTKFLISEVAHMAQQIEGDGSVLWFNNEGSEDRVQQQLWCAVLETDHETIIENEAAAIDKYTEKLHGYTDRIKVFDAFGYTPAVIKAKAEKYNAKLIILDMIDQTVLPGGNQNQEVIRLRSLYREIRVISKEFCPVIGSCQCDGTVTWTDRETGEARFQHYIGMHQLDFSRVAKQSSAEFIITIGRDDAYPKTRYIHVPKNKLDGDGTEKSRFIKSEVIFDGKRSIYYEKTT